MKCPYQISVTHITQDTEGVIKQYSQDVTRFSDCLKGECPFYYITVEYVNKMYSREKVAHCRRAESEDKGVIS